LPWTVYQELACRHSHPGEGKIGAISLFEGLNQDTALVTLRRGFPDCKGIYRAINAEAARVLCRDYIYINRESDMGVEGIREAKMRYNPHHMVQVHLRIGVTWRRWSEIWNLRLP